VAIRDGISPPAGRRQNESAVQIGIARRYDCG